MTSHKNNNQRIPGRLPQWLRPLFWDVDLSALSWEKDRSLILTRVMTSGDWSAVAWVRRRVGDKALKAWIMRRKGRGLDARRLRFWELVLDFPRGMVDRWLSSPTRKIWDKRAYR